MGIEPLSSEQGYLNLLKWQFTVIMFTSLCSVLRIARSKDLGKDLPAQDIPDNTGLGGLIV